MHNTTDIIQELESVDSISVEKSFVDRKPNTKYSKTDKGKKAFENHLSALEHLIKQQYK